jgi:hypothetical protein
MPPKLRRSVAAVAVGAMLCVMAPSDAAAQTDAEVTRVTRTSRWHRPSPDPSGIAYIPGSGKLIVTDGEVEETPQWRGANVWFTTLQAHPTGSWSTRPASSEPTGVAVLGRRTLFLADDDRDRVFRWRRGADRRWGTRDDRVASFSTRPFGSGDPEGVALGPTSLFVIDGADAKVYRLRPGKNGRFDGVPPEGDDRVSSFDTTDLGLRDPEGGVYDPDTGDLFLVSRMDRVIVETTVDGVLVESFDLSASSISRPSDIALAPASDGDSGMHAYVTDRGADNDTDPDENDGRIFEFALS